MHVPHPSVRGHGSVLPTPQNPRWAALGGVREGGSELTWKVRHLTLLVLQGGHVIAGVLSLVLGVWFKVDLQVLPLDTPIPSQIWGVHRSTQHPGDPQLVVALFTGHPTCPSTFYYDASVDQGLCACTYHRVTFLAYDQGCGFESQHLPNRGSSLCMFV